MNTTSSYDPGKIERHWQEVWKKTNLYKTNEPKKGQKTFSELKSIKENELINKEKDGDLYKKFKNIFYDAELLEVKKKE